MRTTNISTCPHLLASMVTFSFPHCYHSLYHLPCTDESMSWVIYSPIWRSLLIIYSVPALTGHETSNPDRAPAFTELSLANNDGQAVSPNRCYEKEVKEGSLSQVCWCRPVTPALWETKAEGLKVPGQLSDLRDCINI